MHEKIKEIIIVEGKTDTAKLKSLFDVDTLETNGLSLSKKKINDIINISKNRGVIIFVDPDGPGEKIRRMLIENIPLSKNCFIKKTDIIKSKKIGIAEAENQAIIDALKNCVTFIKNNNSISWEQYIQIAIDSVKWRTEVCNKLKISYCNNKQLFKRINMMNLSFVDFQNITKDIKNK